MNQLELIVKESGLEATKAEVMLKQFQDYFAIAADWEAKAKTIVVTDESQVDDMKMARTGRLILRDKRIAVENTRKQLKEQSIREGRAIDGIANVLKALIVPIEEYLADQEKFAERKAAERKAEADRIEAARIEAERLAAIEAARIEQERIRLENERLRREADEREAVLRAEREAVERKAAEEKRVAEEKARIEREKAEAEKRELMERLARMVECPSCGHKFEPKRGK